MALKIIIFDCDGVILESIDAKTRAFYRVGLEYGQEAADRLLLFHKLHGGISRFIKFEWLFAEVLHQPLTEDDKNTLNSKFVDYCFDEIKNCQLVPGVLEVLETWQGKIPLFVASGAPQKELELILKKRGLAHFFTGIYGSPPGKTALLRTIIKTTHVPPAEAIMIGDSNTDLLAAENVGMHFYGRGVFFKTSGKPWHIDLTLLNTYLAAFDD